MRILFAHNRYQFSGGEDSVVRDEMDLLRRHGHRVELLEQNNDAIRGLRGSLVAAVSNFYSARSRTRMKQAIHDFRPEIIHVHNWFPMLSPSIILEADSSAIPVVQTLHNFRMLCANALLFRDGVVCTDCLGKPFPIDGILHGCYRGSRAGSAIVTAANAFHRRLRIWDRVDLFLAVSGFQREILLRAGWPEEKVAVKPNFVHADLQTDDGNAEDFALYVGRLSPEKGIRTLLSAWNAGKIQSRLKIIGDGPMRDEVLRCASANPRVEYLGRKLPEDVYREMAKARFLVFPSEWFETFGLTIVEAFAQGTPVLAADLGCARELVEESVTGHRFQPGNPEALALGATRFSLGEDYQRMRTNCRNLFLSKFTAEINYTLLTDLYARAVSARMARRQII